jgi:hypothetical protein
MNPKAKRTSERASNRFKASGQVIISRNSSKAIQQKQIQAMQFKQSNSQRVLFRD